MRRCLMETHTYKLIETYEDGIMFLECPICGDSQLWRGEPHYFKRIQHGNLQVAHSFMSTPPGLGLSMGDVDINPTDK